MDENYQVYLNRVMRMTLPETYGSQVQHIHESPKFYPHPEKGRLATPFPGYTVITPPWGDESENASLYGKLKDYQQQLVQRLPSGLLFPLPSDSFHLTLADLIWDGAYRHANEQPDFQARLQASIAESFQQYQNWGDSQAPIRLQVLGLMVMPRALAVCLVPNDEQSYETIIKFRRSIYQNPNLIALGIEQQYYFTAHITLGYFGEIPADLDRGKLSETFTDLNQQWLDADPQEFWIKRAELRKFDDMTHYYREPDWATLDF